MKTPVASATCRTENPGPPLPTATASPDSCQPATPIGAERPLRVASIGLGWVTTHRHLPAMRAAKRKFDIVGVIDGRPGRAESVARDFRIRRHSEARSFAEVPWLDEIDAVTVGTAPMSHHSLIREALDSGLHVLTEKPFAMTVDEGSSLVDLARDNGRILAIVHNFQFARSMRALLADIETGRLGPMRSVSAIQLGNPRRRLPEWYRSLPLGLFYDESPHLLYLIRRVCGAEPKLKRALLMPDPDGGATPATIDIHYAAETADGRPLPVSIRCNFTSPISEWYLTVHGDRYLSIVDIFRDIYLRLPNDGRHDTRSVLRTSLTAWYQHWWQHLPSGVRHLTGRLRFGNDEVFSRFAESATRNIAPACIGSADALAVLRMQHDIIAAAEPLV